MRTLTVDLRWSSPDIYPLFSSFYPTASIFIIMLRQVPKTYDPKAKWGQGLNRLSHGESLKIIDQVISPRSRSMLMSSPGMMDSVRPVVHTPDGDAHSNGSEPLPGHAPSGTRGHLMMLHDAAGAAQVTLKSPHGSSSARPRHPSMGGGHDLSEATEAFATLMAKVPPQLHEDHAFDLESPTSQPRGHASSKRHHDGAWHGSGPSRHDHQYPRKGHGRSRHDHQPHDCQGNGQSRHHYQPHYQGNGKNKGKSKGRHSFKGRESPYVEQLLTTPSQPLIPRHSHSSPHTGPPSHKKARVLSLMDEDQLHHEDREIQWSQLVEREAAGQVQLARLKRQVASLDQENHRLRARNELLHHRAVSTQAAKLDHLQYELAKLEQRRRALEDRNAQLNRTLSCHASLPSHPPIPHASTDDDGDHHHPSTPPHSEHQQEELDPPQARLQEEEEEEAELGGSQVEVHHSPLHRSSRTEDEEEEHDRTRSSEEEAEEDAQAIPHRASWGYVEEGAEAEEARKLSSLPSPLLSEREDTSDDEENDDEDVNNDKKVKKSRYSRSSSSSSSSSNSVPTWAILPFENVESTGPYHTITHRDIRRFLSQFPPMTNTAMAHAVLAHQHGKVNLKQYPPIYHLYHQYDDPEVFYATWTLALKSLVSDANGKGGLGGTREPQLLGTGNPAPASVPLYPGEPTPLMEKLIPHELAEQLRRLPTIDRLAAETALLMQAVDVSPDLHLPTADQYEANYTPGSTEWVKSRNDRRNEYRRLHLMFLDRFKSALEQESRNSLQTAIRPAAIKVPEFHGTGSHPDYRTWLDAVAQYAISTQMAESTLIPLLPTSIKDATLRKWLSDELVRSGISTLAELNSLFEARYNRQGIHDQYLENLLDNLKPQPGTTFSSHLDTFVKIVAQLRRTYPAVPPAEGSDAYKTEQHDIKRFLQSIPTADREWIWAYIDHARHYSDNQSRYALLLQAVASREAQMCQTSNCTEYFLIPADSGKSVSRHKTKAVMMGDNTVMADNGKDPLLDSVVAAIDKWGEKMTEAAKKRPYNPKNDRHNSRNTAPTQTGNDKRPRRSDPDFVATADLEKVQREQLQADTHFPYIRLTVKETGQFLCTLCAQPGHNFRDCPKKDTLRPFRVKNLHKRNPQGKQDF